jgi:putative spermidine/putrescine transport system permease protein/mannopine transport system permease protein
MAIAAVPLLFILYTSFGGAAFSLDSFRALMESRLFMRSLYTTVEISLLASLISLGLGYVVALHLARQPPRRRVVWMVFVLLPFWTSILVKSYAFTVILGREGLINLTLSWLTGTQVAIPMILNRVGVMIGMTNYLTPFIVFPVLASLLAIDPALYRAADIMGARPTRVFFTITLPLSLPGVIAGVSSVAVMSLGFFVIPALLGGRQDVMLANLVDFYTRETLDWNMAAAIGVLLLAMVVLISGPALWMRRRQLAGSV